MAITKIQYSLLLAIILLPSVSAADNDSISCKTAKKDTLTAYNELRKADAIQPQDEADKITKVVMLYLAHKKIDESSTRWLWSCDLSKESENQLLSAIKDSREKAAYLEEVLNPIYNIENGSASKQKRYFQSPQDNQDQSRRNHDWMLD